MLREGVTITENNFETVKLPESNNFLSIYTMQINPEALELIKAGSGALVYRKYQNWFDGKNIKESKRGKYLESVNLNIVKVNTNNNFNLEVLLNRNTDLWTVANNLLYYYKDGISVNCGYFVVQGNISPLVDGIINQEDVVRKSPLGYYFNKKDLDNSGTRLPVPKPYREYFAVISYSKDTGFKMTKYTDFINRHLTIEESILYKLDNNTYYTTTQSVIKMGNNTKIGGIPRHSNGFPMDEYDLAFCSGPILIWEGQIVFNLDIMLNKEFAIIESDISNSIQEKPPNMTKYKLVNRAYNNFMFKASEYEGNQIYGMRHSARYMVHNVMAVDTNGQIIFFYIEGRGYDAPGLDRVQLSQLISKFNIINAVSLDGGFSANAVFKTDGSQLRYLMNDPEKRELGVTMTIRQKDNKSGSDVDEQKMLDDTEL